MMLRSVRAAPATAAGRGREGPAHPRGRRLPAQADQRGRRRCRPVQRPSGRIHQGPGGHAPPDLYRDPAGRHAGYPLQDYHRRADAKHPALPQPRHPDRRATMNRITQIAIVAVLGIGTYVAISAIYTVSEVEQVIITQFGKPVGDPVTSAGLKVKILSSRTSPR